MGTGIQYHIYPAISLNKDDHMRVIYNMLSFYQTLRDVMYENPGNRKTKWYVLLPTAYLYAYIQMTSNSMFPGLIPGEFAKKTKISLKPPYLWTGIELSHIWVTHADLIVLWYQWSGGGSVVRWF